MRLDKRWVPVIGVGVMALTIAVAMATGYWVSSGRVAIAQKTAAGTIQPDILSGVPAPPRTRAEPGLPTGEPDDIKGSMTLAEVTRPSASRWLNSRPSPGCRPEPVPTSHCASSRTRSTGSRWNRSGRPSASGWRKNNTKVRRPITKKGDCNDGWIRILVVAPGHPLVPVRRLWTRLLLAGRLRPPVVRAGAPAGATGGNAEADPRPPAGQRRDHAGGVPAATAGVERGKVAAQTELKRCAGSQFDPQLMARVLPVLDRPERWSKIVSLAK